MRIASLAPWYGGKRTLAPRVVEQLGPHSTYWEPFCGSCAVLFAKPACAYESVNDLHGDLINLALVVQHEATALELYGRVVRTLFHEELLDRARQVLVGDLGPPPAAEPPPDPDRAYWYLVSSWMGLNGVSGTPLGRNGTFSVRYSAKGGNGATRWASVGASIPDWHRRLAGVQILRRDGLEILARLDDAAGTAVYADPPYLAKSARYLHDFGADDPGRLADLLRRFRKARVVVSYYDDPGLERLYPGWGRVRCGVAKAMVQGGRRDRSGRVEAPEVLLTNGPVFGEGLGLF